MNCEPSRDEARLLSRLADDDPAIRTELFRRYNGVMRRRASLILRDSGAVEDAVQDAWLTVLTCLRDFGGRSGLLTWIVAITLNCARNRLRKDRRFVSISAQEPTDSDLTADEPPGGRAPLAINGITPELLLLRHEAMQHLEAALERMPESLKSVVLLRDVAGATSGEACRLLAIKDGAQRTRLHRGRARLRQALGASLAAP